jgi:hypothetical protein
VGSNDFASWSGEHASVIVMVILVSSASVSNLLLLSSHLLGKPYFSMPCSPEQKMGIKLSRPSLLLEDIPQIVIQMIVPCSQRSFSCQHLGNVYLASFHSRTFDATWHSFLLIFGKEKWQDSHGKDDLKAPSTKAC